MPKTPKIINNIRKVTRNGARREISQFTSVNNYLLNQFGEVPDAEIFLISQNAMEGCGFQGCAGLFCEQENIVLIVKDFSYSFYNPGSIRDKLLRTLFRKMCKSCTTIEIEDIVVHESLHALSALINRSGRRYTYNEEEFVYTNSVDFYRHKGMDDRTTINSIFMPFCVNHILGDYSQMSKIFAIVGSSSDDQKSDCIMYAATAIAEKMMALSHQTARPDVEKSANKLERFSLMDF